jgi:hypothetical protein
MGGSGSSRWEGTQTRLCVESCFSVAPPRGKLFPRTCVLRWEWSGVTVRCTLLRDGAGGFTLLLVHDYRGGGRQSVRLVETRPNYGGRRWWFLCPACGARAGRLHLPGRGLSAHEFKCRRCHDLTYESAQSSRSFVRALFLLRASELGCSYREARDDVRRAPGSYLYAPKVLAFERADHDRDALGVSADELAAHPDEFAPILEAAKT